jgi:hypothetical protein
MSTVSWPEARSSSKNNFVATGIIVFDFELFMGARLNVTNSLAVPKLFSSLE